MSDEPLLAELRRLEIETPSWGYGNSGTRFHAHPWPGAARSVWERIADAGLVAGGYADRLAKERGTAGVESAYERL